MVKDTSEYEYKEQKQRKKRKKSAFLQRFVILEKESENEKGSHQVLASAWGSRHAGRRKKAPRRVCIYKDTVHPEGFVSTRSEAPTRGSGETV